MSSSSNACVVDTNVPLTANGGEDRKCRLACVQALDELKRTGHLVIDDKFRILKEYTHKLSPTGQPGVGDAFLKWALTNHTNPERCTRVTLTPKLEDARDFEEFPPDESLSGFDPADRKFIAVSCAHPERPPILQATDSKWWGLRKELAACGIQVSFLCPRHIEELHKRKSGT